MPSLLLQFLPFAGFMLVGTVWVSGLTIGRRLGWEG